MKRLILGYFLLHSLLFAGLFDFQTIQEAKEAYGTKAYHRSIEALNSLPKKYPQTWYDLGNAYYKVGEYQKAIASYKKAKGEGVGELKRFYNIGNSYFQQKAYAKAIEAYTKALQVQKDAQAEHNLAFALLRLNYALLGHLFAPVMLWYMPQWL